MIPYSYVLLPDLILRGYFETFRAVLELIGSCERQYPDCYFRPPFHLTSETIEHYFEVASSVANEEILSFLEDLDIPLPEQ